MHNYEFLIYQVTCERVGCLSLPPLNLHQPLCIRSEGQTYETKQYASFQVLKKKRKEDKGGRGV